MARAFSAPYHQLTRAFAVPHSWQFTLSVAFVAQVFSAVGYSMMFPFLPLHIETLGTTTGLSTELAAGLVISVQGLTMMVTAPFWGVAADRFGRKRMIMRAMFGGAITMAMMGFAQTAEQLILIRAMQGLVTGTVSANNALVAAATPRHRVGFAMGALQLGLWAGVAVGPLMGGILADHFGYNIPYLVTGVLLMIGGLVVFFGVSESFSTSKEAVELRPLSLIRGWKDILPGHSRCEPGADHTVSVGPGSDDNRADCTALRGVSHRPRDRREQYLRGPLHGCIGGDIYIWRGLARQPGRPHQPPKSALLLFSGGRHILCTASACRRYLAAAHLAGIGRDRGRRIGRFAQRLALALCRHRARRRDLWAGEFGHVGLARGRAHLRRSGCAYARYARRFARFSGGLCLDSAYRLVCAAARYGRASPTAIKTSQDCLIPPAKTSFACGGAPVLYN